MWGILSGVSEPFGALFGYVVLKGSMSGNTYGIMFGLVAGIMTLIAADELLPTAHRYDPKNEVVTYAFIFGMFAIASSLVIFSN
jgi:zinc transporter, ZIP family